MKKLQKKGGFQISLWIKILVEKEDPSTAPMIQCQIMNQIFEKNKKKLATCVMAFEKNIPRKPLLNPIFSKAVNHYDYDFY